MKTLFAAVLLASTVVSFGAANAAGGCGPGFHRGPYGGCRVNGGVVVARGVAARCENGVSRYDASGTQERRARVRRKP